MIVYTLVNHKREEIHNAGIAILVLYIKAIRYKFSCKVFVVLNFLSIRILSL